MKDNSNNNPGTNGSGNLSLPLYDFFVALKQNNFSITPAQIADCNCIINEYASHVKNEQELCTYLSSIIANTQEEQIQFKEIFDSFYKDKAGTTPPPPPPPPTWRERIKKHIITHWLKYLGAVILILSAVILFYFTVEKTPPIPVITIAAVQPDTASNGRVDIILNSSDTTNQFELNPIYDWGDATSPDSLLYHNYKKEGTYRVSATVAVFYKNKQVHTAMPFDSVNVCVNRPQVKIIQSFAGDEIYVGDKINVSAEIPAGDAKDITWLASGDRDDKTGEGKKFSVSFNRPGNHTITCTFSPPGSPCSGLDKISFFVKDTGTKPAVVLAATQNAAELKPSVEVKRSLYYIMGPLTFLSLFLTIFFTIKRNRVKNNPAPVDAAAKEEYKKKIDAFSGKAGGQQLVFAGKNYLPLPEKEISDVARMMRMRINDESPYLDIPKTIAEAIDNAGFFDPVYSTRTQQCEYLVLIDEINSNSQQVKLFDYLIDLLAKQNVFIEKFYYRHDPGNCYNALTPHGISLEKLSEKFPRHILLIMGNAYQLIYPTYPIIISNYLQLLHRWQYKAILTPLSFTDWGNKEKKVLYEEMPIVPVDITGQILLLQKLFIEEINIMAELHQHSRDFYEADSLDFEDIDELYEYCENAGWATVAGGGKYSNILFQWIAALATWPRVNWEFTLATGKSILDKYGKLNELNFTNLLRIARIKWMRDGKFPDYTRLELLKKLSKENEITARETILVLLNEIPGTELYSDHFAYEEKEMQRLMNEFILYAYDPLKYESYKRSKDIFSQLNENGQVTDLTGKKYLENDNLEYETLINIPKIETGGERPNTTLNDYFTSESTFLKKLYSRAGSLSAVIFLISLIGFAGLIVIGITGTKRFPWFIDTAISTRDIKFNFSKQVVAAGISDTTFTVEDTTININGDSIYTVPVNVNDSFKNINISINGNAVFDTAMVINRSGYTIAITNKSRLIGPNTTDNKQLTANFILAKSCIDSLTTYSYIIDEADTSVNITNTISTATSVNGNCLSHYSYGKTANVEKVNAIINQFRKNGIELVLNRQPAFAVPDNTIVFYNPPATNNIPDKPVVYIQVSDNSLMSSADRFRKELVAKGIDARTVSIQNYSYNSEISYYDAGMRSAANDLKQYYNRYYPEMNVQARLRQIADVERNKNVIAVWIKKLQTPPTPIYKIQNAKVPPQVKQGEDIGIAFEITRTGAITNMNNANPAQQNNTGNMTGNICIASSLNCVSFNINPNSSRTSVQKQLNTKGLKPGRYQVTASVDVLKLSQQLGSFTITGTGSGCDTVRSTVDRVSRNYMNLDLQEKGIQLKVNSIDNNVFGSFTIKKGNCAEQRVVIYDKQQRQVTLCDKTVFYFTLNGKNFVAVICNN